MLRILLKNGANISGTGSGRIVFLPRRVKHAQAMVLTVLPSEGGYGCHDDIFPLFVATKVNQLSVIEELLFAGAPVNQKNALGQTALHVCSRNNDGSNRVLELPSNLNNTTLNVMRLLIESGAQIDVQDSNGDTPLHYACKYNNRYLVKILLEKGGDVSLKNHKGQTPLDVAAHEDHEIVKTIMQKGVLPHLQLIEALESVALVSRRPYEVLLRAAEMRKTHNLPKIILDPLPCYGFIKEFETLEELKNYREDNRMLRLQAVLARERVWTGRYVDFMKEDALEGIDITTIYVVNCSFKFSLYLYLALTRVLR